MCSGASGAWGIFQTGSCICLGKKYIMEKWTKKIRINKYLSEAGFCSRREADSLIRNGRVTVEGHKAEPGEKITADTVVFVDGKPVKKVEEKVLLLFHKPRGVVCSTKKQRQETTVTEYLNYPVRIYPIGRLDKESEGLLLLTNQGDLVNKIMRAGNYHEKEYLVTVNKPVDSDFVKKMSSGIPILDTITRPCFVEKTGRNSFRIILTQGLNRQIRRMCEYLGYQVLSLKRVRIMELTIDGLKEGGYREATQEEWKKLERGIADSSQLPAARRQDSVPVFSKKQGRDSIPFSSIPEEKKGKISQLLPALFQKNGSLSHRGSLLAVIITVKQEDIMENSLQRMKELVEKLDQAAKAYYQEDREIMSNQEYDSLYDQLEQLEKETGTVLTNSPTVRVGYEAVNELPKEEHPSPMLSLDKTKDREVLRGFIGNHKCLLSWKLDGLTIVLTYENGELVKAVTRGNGIVGEVITNNARVFRNIPLRIPYKGQLVLRGEAIITYSEFERINETIGDADAKYKNPRNLCSGSVRQLNNEITAKRNVRFYAFALVSAQDVDFSNSREQQFIWLKKQGFEVVEYKVVTSESLDEAMDYFSKTIVNNDFPSDGLVVTYDDIAYGESLGSTAKFPRNSFAFKWADEMRETRLVDMEWSPSRTGLINPVAIFEPVELEGTTVSRASVHNISIVKELQLGIGDTIKVYKANMIIPQIAENLTRSGNLVIPDKCPVCGREARIRKENDVETLYCMNPDCVAKKIKSFSLFTSRDAMNIDGLSEATLEKFIAMGFIHNFGDIFEIGKYKDQIVEMEGFGQKSFDNLMVSLEKAKKPLLPR